MPPTLKNVMVFLTGCDVIPAMGYDDVSPSISFMDHGVMPTVSTCLLTFNLPIYFPTDYKQFKEKMDFAILASQGFFGQV